MTQIRTQIKLKMVRPRSGVTVALQLLELASNSNEPARDFVEYIESQNLDVMIYDCVPTRSPQFWAALYSQMSKECVLSL